MFLLNFITSRLDDFTQDFFQLQLTVESPVRDILFEDGSTGFQYKLIATLIPRLGGIQIFVSLS